MHDILTYRHEVYRKYVHISSCSTIAFLLWYWGKDIFLPYILVVAILFAILDFLRKHILFIKHISITLFGKVIRSYELHVLSGASWVFIGAGSTIYLFNEKVALIALLVIGISDSAAALVGIKYGNTRFFNKSLEGSLAFFVSTYLIILVMSSPSYTLLLITTITVTTVELFSTKKLNDNILIPIATALILTIGGIY